MTGATYCAGGAGSPDDLRDLPVGSGFAIWDLTEHIPDRPAKITAIRRKRHGKILSGAVQIRLKLPHGFRQDRRYRRF